MSKNIDIKQMKIDAKKIAKSEKRERRAKVWHVAKHYVIAGLLLVSVIGLIQLGMYIQRQNDAGNAKAVYVHLEEVKAVIQAVKK